MKLDNQKDDSKDPKDSKDVKTLQDVKDVQERQKKEKDAKEAHQNPHDPDTNYPHENANNPSLNQPDGNPNDPSVLIPKPSNNPAEGYQGDAAQEKMDEPLTQNEKDQGITLEEKQRRARILKAQQQGTAPDDVVALNAAHDREREAELRDRHIEANPQHATWVDNNPVKVTVFVNKTSHSVPPGPMTVGAFKQMTRTAGTKLSMDGKELSDDGETMTFKGGEVFFTEGFLR